MHGIELVYGLDTQAMYGGEFFGAWSNVIRRDRRGGASGTPTRIRGGWLRLTRLALSLWEAD